MDDKSKINKNTKVICYSYSGAEITGRYFFVRLATTRWLFLNVNLGNNQVINYAISKSIQEWIDTDCVFEYCTETIGLGVQAFVRQIETKNKIKLL